MSALRRVLPPLLLVLGLASGWLALAPGAMRLRVRLPASGDAAAQALAAQPGCEVDPGLDAEALLALLEHDLDDTGCAGGRRVVRLLAASSEPALVEALSRGLAGRRWSERARLWVALATVAREGELGEDLARELGRSSLSPRSREALVAALSETLGPEVVDAALLAGGQARYDAGHSLAALRLAEGDTGARTAVIEAMEHELARPTLPASPEDPGLSGRRARLASAALAALGLDEARLQEIQDRRARRLPLQGLPGPLAMALADEPPPCEDLTSPACARRLIELLSLPPEPLSGWEPPELGPPGAPRLALPPPWDARIAEASRTPTMLEEAAWWVAQAKDAPEARLLGVLANRDHAYGPSPFAAGQRGDPADAVRYGGATPGATALAALALADTVGVPLELAWWEGTLVLGRGGLRAFVGPCGPGTAKADPALYLPELGAPLGAREALALAWMEQVAASLTPGTLAEARAAADQVDALRADAGLPDPVEPFGGAWAELRGALLAADGVALPGLDADARARVAAWARALGQDAVSLRLVGPAPAEPPPTAPCERALQLPPP